jgi:hypothetical protein
VSNEDRYRALALDCTRLAAVIGDPQSRLALLEMAQAWLKLADHAQKNGEADLVYETPER